MSTAPSPALITVSTAIEQVTKEHGLQSTDGIASLREAYAPHFLEFQALAERSRGIPVTAPKAARAIRLELKAIRVAAESTRKRLKEDSLLRGRAIDGVKALLDYQLVPIENAMEEIEKAEERAEEARRAALKVSRTKDLAPYVRDPGLYDLGAMPDADWQSLLTGAKVGHKLEQERLAKEAAEKAAAEKRQAREAEQRKAAEAAAKAKAESDAREAAAREQARKDREAREKAEAELAAKAKQEADRIAAEKAAARKAARAPERQKLTTFAATVRALSVPSITDATLAEKIHDQVAKFAAWIEAEASKLS